MMENAHIDSTIEALILASPEPLPVGRINQVLASATPSRVAAAVAKLNSRYAQTGSAFRIREIAGGYQHYILPEYVGFVEELFTRRRKLRLTRAALETAAIVAYRQPVTRSEVEHIRGVASDGVIQNLLEKGLVTMAGRAKSVGRPLQYQTTDEFLKFFGLNCLEDLPKMSEIEEMIAAQQNQSQTELQFLHASPVDGREQKLNIVDGTFDPQRRQCLLEASRDPDSVSPAGTPLPRLVLKSSTETEAVRESAEESGEESSVNADLPAAGRPENVS
ncbi:MAG TPA: SMC-Scp complex subunit ScpB [Acidobacteriota bacterium]|nr:SMC-Scp complex subunit ScpB [Acidobacteriota bacterium]